MKLKNLLANKNVVTIIGAILIVIVLYFFYNYRVNQAINPVSVPYALVTIGPRTEITSDKIGYMDVQPSALKESVLTRVKDIEGMYTNVNCTIPAGSLFYGDLIVQEKELPDAFLKEKEIVNEGMVPYNFKVNVNTTYGNSIYPDTYVDVYFKGLNNGKIILGKLITNVKVLAVKDNAGRHVFENMTEERTPSQIIFAVTEEIHELLRVAEYIKDAELIIVPTGVSYRPVSAEGGIVTEITDAEIKSFIEQNRY